jgi:UDP-glucose 4-epimerase
MLPRPLSPYAVQKLTCEYYIQSFYRAYGLEGVCLRYFNIFGPRQDPDSPYSGVLSRFSTAFLDSTPPVVFGDGEQTRDFTYVDNAVAANILACEAPSASGRTFNVGTGQAVSLNQVLQMLEKASGKTLETRYEPAREGDIRDSLADIRLAKQFLSYQPTVLFEEGLERAYAWYQANHAKNVPE